MKTFLVTLVLLAVCGPTFVTAQQQPITLKDVPAGLPVISADEPMAAGFSVEKAAQYLDRSAAELGGEDQVVRRLPIPTCSTWRSRDRRRRTILPDSG